MTMDIHYLLAAYLYMHDVQSRKEIGTESEEQIGG